MSLVWEADGNPKPEIQCNDSLAENVRASTVGRQKIITITGATSTNAGRYICVATNKVGKVTRSTTLLLKGIILCKKKLSNIANVTKDEKKLYKEMQAIVSAILFFLLLQISPLTSPSTGGVSYLSC